MNEKPARRGQALVEFALVSFALIFLLMGAIGIGMMLVQATATGSVAISASMLLDQQVRQDDVSTEEDIYAELRRLNLYNDAHLILSPSDYREETYQGGELASLNRKMLPLYQYDPDHDVYRYPGAPVVYNGSDAILIPRVERGTSETITEWFRPVELEIDPNSGGKVVNVSVNMASQPMTLLSYPTDEFGNTIAPPLVADDSSVQVQAPLPNGFSFNVNNVTQAEIASTNRGVYGLGEMYNFATTVRPFRAVIFHRGTFRLISPDPA